MLYRNHTCKKVKGHEHSISIVSKKRFLQILLLKITWESPSTTHNITWWVSECLISVPLTLCVSKFYQVIRKPPNCISPVLHPQYAPLYTFTTTLHRVAAISSTDLLSFDPPIRLIRTQQSVIYLPRSLIPRNPAQTSFKHYVKREF